MLSVFVFFLQAEDGIRGAQESRGLGDVYKRQVNRKEADLKEKLPPNFLFGFQKEKEMTYFTEAIALAEDLL